MAKLRDEITSLQEDVSTSNDQVFSTENPVSLLI